MALLLLTSIAAAFWLAFSGNVGIVALGLGLAAAAFGVAWMMDVVLVQLEDLALAVHTRWGTIAAAPVALLCGCLPTLVVMVWAFDCYHWFKVDETVYSLDRWLLSYGVATGPWTLFALIVSKDRRTLSGIRAYAVHLAYWLLSASLFLAPTHPVLAAALMLIPAILPVTMGTAIACADRAMLATVRI
jgi:hypothetical protein